MKITKVYGREILDSRGHPTVECTLVLDHETFVTASVPSGASVGSSEAVELRDNDPERFMGKGVLHALDNLLHKIAPALIGKQPDLHVMDQEIIDLDGTENKAHLGANATLAASIAIARAQALLQRCELYEFLNKTFHCGPTSFPRCMFNLINGGVHADDGLTFQEFMIMPRTVSSVAQTLQIATSVYHHLHALLKEKGLSTGIGDEGGFAPQFQKSSSLQEHLVLDLLMHAIERAGFTHDQVGLCLDVAASTFHSMEKGYTWQGRSASSSELILFYEQLINDYPILSIEDGMSENDWFGWQDLTKKLGAQLQLVGDDIFVTNVHKIEKGISLNVANAVLIKPNQIGTVSETVAAIQLCKKTGYNPIVSHRSGETNDSFIADLVVGCAAGQFKAGSPCRGERVAKYNRLLEIEKQLHTTS